MTSFSDPRGSSIRAISACTKFAFEHTDYYTDSRAVASPT